MARAAGAPRAKKWVFTLNNYTAEHVAHLSTLFPLVCSYLVFGREIAPETGTRHLQGFAHFVDRKSLLQAVASLGQGSHCEVARGSSLQASIYCKKEADYEEFGVLSDSGKRTDWHELKDFLKESDVFPTEADLIERFPTLMGTHQLSVLKFRNLLYRHPNLVSDNLRGWQLDLAQRLSADPDDRSILFVVDYPGGTGKTYFQQWCFSHRDDVQLLLTGKRDDMAHAVNVEKSVFLINVPRGGMEYLQYTVLEMLKDRVVHSPKYNSTTKILSKCHVVVFANDEPDMLKMTRDRYVMLRIEDDRFIDP